MKHPVAGLSRESSQKKKRVPRDVPEGDRRVPKKFPSHGTAGLPRLAVRGTDYTCRVTAKVLSGDIDDLKLAREIRLEADRAAPMSVRLARVHLLCKQMSAIKGAARARD